MTRILLVGKNGQIGWELKKILQEIVDITAVGRSELDVTDRQAAQEVCSSIKPDIVINATGYNDVNGAEANRNNAAAVNVTGNANLASAAMHSHAFYITYSTDYIFDGRKGSAYIETDLPRPVNFYGKTKLDGEQAVENSGVDHMIIRTSSVFSLHRACFLKNFLKQAQPGARIRARTDLTNSPTSARCLAENTAQIITKYGDDRLEYLKERAGTYHLAGGGSASRYEWAREIQNMLNLNIELVPATSLDFPSDVTRPAFSELESSRFSDIFRLQIPPWQQLLKETLKETS